MSFIPEHQINEIKERVEIVDIISEYVNLKKAGSNFKGLCPFHNEKTPSFIVSQEKGNFKCFGCGEGGDAISFIMKIHNITYIEAIKFLAEKMGITLIEQEGSKERTELFKRYYEINSKAAKFYMRNFLTEEFPQAYTKKRGIKAKVCNSYYLGYAKSDNSLYKYLKENGYNEEDMLKLGLIGEKDGRYYDKFRDRLIFPILNTKNKVIGFGGRTLTDSNVKYLNSPESEIFVKGKNVYGVNVVSKNRYRDKIILVEGYMDVISLYNHGIDYALATLGTALTQDQAKLIKRYSTNIYIAYDGDTAGINATLRAIEIFKNLNVQVGILSFPDGKDPDEFISQYGKEGFEKLLTRAVEPIDFKLKKLSDEHLSKMEFINKVTEFLADIEGNVIRDLYLSKAADFIGVSANSMRSDVNNLINENQNKRIQKERFSKNQNIGYTKNNSETKAKKVEDSTLEREVIVYSLLDRKYFDLLRSFKDSFEDFDYKEIYNNISILYNANQPLDEVVNSSKFTERDLTSFYQEAIKTKDISNNIVLEIKERVDNYLLMKRRDELYLLIKEKKVDSSVISEYTDILNKLTKGVK